jgi:hypothetical protein
VVRLGGHIWAAGGWPSVAPTGRPGLDRPDAVETVPNLLARTANRAQPHDVDVSRPSDALAAQAAATKTFTGPPPGLGAANTMMISVLERRAEIGLRRHPKPPPHSIPH